MESIFHKTDCLHCRIADLCLPHGLSGDEVSKLESIVRRKLPAKPDEYLYRQQDLAHSVFMVKTGSFRSFVSDTNGVEQTIGFYLPGELMGLDALENGRYHCSVIALESATLCELPLPRLQELCSKIPSLQSQLMHIIGREILSEHDHIVLLSKRSAREKMATFLLMLSTRYKMLGFSSTEFNLSMRRDDIANFLGLTIETVSRQLTDLSKNGIITVKQRSIHINNLHSLKEIVEPCLPQHFALAN